MYAYSNYSNIMFTFIIFMNKFPNYFMPEFWSTESSIFDIYL